jgi:hypothetical protein
MAVKSTSCHIRARLKTQHFFSNVPIENFFFCETPKTATNFLEVFIISGFADDSRKPVGGFLSPYQISSTASRAIRRVS